MIKKQDIELEAALLKSMALKENYEQFNTVLDTKKLIPLTFNLIKDYAKYYEKYNEDINWETFYIEFSQNWHKKDLDGQDITYYRDVVFPLIRDAEVNSSLYTTLLERQAACSIMENMDEGFDENKILDILKILGDKKSPYAKIDDDVFKLTNLDLSVLDPSTGLSWFLPTLQAGINSHMPGQFVVVAADSGAGKSAFCISQAAHVFKQINEARGTRPILYLTSEDTKEDLAGRFLSCLYKDRIQGGFEDIVKEYEKVHKHYSKTYNDELFIGMEIRRPKDMIKIQKKINMYNPCVIIIDMIDVLSDSLDILSITKTYNTIRGIANDGYPIIGTTQAGNTSYADKDNGGFKHRKWLNEKDMAGSKGGGKQGAAYCSIGIGQDDDVPGVRYLSTTKKKRGKHVSVTCVLNEKFSLYSELL